MDKRFADLAAAAADSYGVFTTTTARALGVSDRLRHEWIGRGYIERLGKHTFRFLGTPSSWHAALAAGLGELGHGAAIAGRSAGTLNRLDGFNPGPVEIWAPRASRNRCANSLARTNDQPLLAGDVLTIDGLRCVSAERLILDALLFQFTTNEIHNAIDSAIRMRLVDEKRLRRRIVDDLVINAKHRRVLIESLVDTGGESALERRFLAIVRRAGLPRPRLQRVYRSGTRTMARVDAEFEGGLVVELAGHGAHSSRLQRQRDEQRRTELTLLGKRPITFTYDDVYGRPNWIVSTLQNAGIVKAA
jgi:hypothetical protein